MIPVHHLVKPGRDGLQGKPVPAHRQRRPSQGLRLTPRASQTRTSSTTTFRCGSPEEAHHHTDKNGHVKPAKAAAPQAAAATGNATTATAAGTKMSDQKLTKEPPTETTIKGKYERTDKVEPGRTTATSGDSTHARPTCRSSSPMDVAKPAACLTVLEPSPATAKMEMGQDRDASPPKHRSDHRKPPTAPAVPPKYETAATGRGEQARCCLPCPCKRARARRDGRSSQDAERMELGGQPASYVPNMCPARTARRPPRRAPPATASGTPSAPGSLEPERRIWNHFPHSTLDQTVDDCR